MPERVIPVSHVRSQHRAETGRHVWVRFTSAKQSVIGPRRLRQLTKRKQSGWWGCLRNVSSSGLAVRLVRSFEPGTLLTIELSDRATRRRCFLPVQVLDATAEGMRIWLIGCEFVRPLSGEEQQSLFRD